MKDYKNIATPLIILLKNNAFYWSTTKEESFYQLKVGMWYTLVLAMPYFFKTLTIESDPFGVEIKAILMQEGWPLALRSKALWGKNFAKSTYKK